MVMVYLSCDPHGGLFFIGLSSYIAEFLGFSFELWNHFVMLICGSLRSLALGRDDMPCWLCCGCYNLWWSIVDSHLIFYFLFSIGLELLRRAD
jgi:hypothetical protein